LNAFFAWTSWTSVTPRPGQDFSYTNNWPYEPAAGNVPTTSTYTWSWASLISLALLAVAIYYLYRWLFPKKKEDEEAEYVPPVEAKAPTPSQHATGKWFVIVPIILFAQALAGTLMAHYYADRSSWFAVEMLKLMPFNVTKAWHIQLAIFWIAAAWMGTGLFLAPVIGKKEPRFQKALVNILWVAVGAVVALSSLGVWLGVKLPLPDGLWSWVGNQGLEYLQLGKLFQLLVLGALLIWGGVLARAFWPGLKGRHTWSSVEHLLLYSGLAIGVTYIFGLLPLDRDAATMTAIDFWRWWVVHLWVEQSFEFFAAAMSAYLLMAVGLVSRKLAERATYFELILIFLGGVIGTGHHLYWAGGPSMWVPMGSMFSFIEVLPLVLLIIEAINQHRLIRKHGAQFKYRLAYTYIIGAAFWNFVGAGVFGGGTLNAPLVNYYEHGTFLTLNHAHTALFGAFGLLAIGLVYFCLRYAAGERAPFNEKIGLWAFWLYNAGVILWILLNFFPIGWAQLDAVYEHGLAFARSGAFYKTTLFWQWMRLPGDVVFAAGALLMAWDFFIKAGPLLPQFLNFSRPEANAPRAAE
jgi:nitric oxide reductase subunit B